jgi:hypothetical protein
VFGACSGGDDSNFVRGRGLQTAALAPAAQAGVYEAAVRGAFEVDDPSLSLLLDPRELPRTVGLDSAARLPSAVVSAMRERGIVKGTCEPPLIGRRTPRCSAARPGYVVRFSPVFALRGDSLAAYVFAQKYDTPSSGYSEPLRFERVYHVVRSGDGWRAALEGRVPKDIRGER